MTVIFAERVDLYVLILLKINANEFLLLTIFGEYVVLCAIWYYSYNLKNVKNTHGGVLLIVKLQALACNFTKSKTSL